MGKEAEITPQTMDVTIQDKYGSHKYRGVRSDEASWNSAVLNLSGSGFTAMSARIDSIKTNQPSYTPAQSQGTVIRRRSTPLTPPMRVRRTYGHMRRFLVQAVMRRARYG